MTTTRNLRLAAALTTATATAAMLVACSSHGDRGDPAASSAPHVECRCHHIDPG
jgi:hypothetical protein